MAIVLFIGILICFGLIVIVQSKWRQDKAELTQEIDYLNRNLNEDNLTIFFTKRSFDVKDTHSIATPRIIYDDQNMKNTSYKRAIDDFEKGRKVATITTILLLVLLVILIVILIFSFPEFVIELFKNNGPE